LLVNTFKMGFEKKLLSSKHMKTLSAIFFISILTIACGRPDAVNTREEINESVEGVPIFQPSQPDSSLFGSYRGVLAEEEGESQMKLSLYEDNSFFLQKRCLSEAAMICEYRGDFKYDKDSQSIRFSVDGKVYRFSIGENLLYLLDKDGKRVQVTIDKTSFLGKSELSLGNTIWQFEKIGDSSLEEQLKRSSYLRFLSDGSLVYNINCNDCRAQWQILVEGELVIRGGVCTKKMCDHPHEAAFNKMLSSIMIYEIEGNKLILKDKTKVLAILSTPF